MTPQGIEHAAFRLVVQCLKATAPTRAPGYYLYQFICHYMVLNSTNTACFLGHVRLSEGSVITYLHDRPDGLCNKECCVFSEEDTNKMFTYYLDEIHTSEC
jgi:hypothetical protein